MIFKLMIMVFIDLENYSIDLERFLIKNMFLNQLTKLLLLLLLY